MRRMPSIGFLALGILGVATPGALAQDNIARFVLESSWDGGYGGTIEIDL